MAKIKSPNLVMRDNMIMSPLALRSNIGFKTPTTEMHGIELNVPVKQTMKGNY